MIAIILTDSQVESLKTNTPVFVDTDDSEVAISQPILVKKTIFGKPLFIAWIEEIKYHNQLSKTLKLSSTCTDIPRQAPAISTHQHHTF